MGEAKKHSDTWAWFGDCKCEKCRAWEASLNVDDDGNCKTCGKRADCECPPPSV